MSIYNNETSKIYPDLNPTAPQEPQTYRLEKITEVEVYLLDEIEAHRREAKKVKLFNTIKGIIGTGLITSAAITGGAFIPAFASGVGLPAGTAIEGIGVVLSLLMVATRKLPRGLTVRQGKNTAIMLLAQSKLDSIANIISRAMQDGDTSPTEVHKVLQEVEKYCKLKADIRSRTKAKIKQITKEQQEEILEQGRKEGKENF